jgi:hypothetical protein
MSLWLSSASFTVRSHGGTELRAYLAEPLLLLLVGLNEAAAGARRAVIKICSVLLSG